MSTWFGRGADDGSADEPTGQVPARVIADAIEEADREGTGPADSASKPHVEPVSAPGRVDLEQALADRHALIQLCLYALDRARSGGVVQRLEQGLAEIGVTPLRPDGRPFDPAWHEAGAAVPTDDAALDGTVAETEVVGFADRDRLLRAPVVTVYTRR